MLALVFAVFGSCAVPALAKNGSSGGGGNSGSGGGGDDDNDRDDNDRDDGDDRDDDDDKEEDDDSRNRIRDAVKRGDAASLRDILAAIRKRFKGEIVRIRLTGSGRNLVYRVRLIERSGRVIDLRVNARTRRIIDVRRL
jgi:uncharacterized membrane protein YkoI